MSGFFHSEIYTLVKTLAFSTMCGGVNYMHSPFLRYNIYGAQLKFFSFLACFNFYCKLLLVQEMPYCGRNGLYSKQLLLGLPAAVCCLGVGVYVPLNMKHILGWREWRIPLRCLCMLL